MSGKSDGTCTTNRARSTPVRSVVNGSLGRSACGSTEDGDLMPQRPSGLDPLVDGGDIARPGIHPGHEQKLHCAASAQRPSAGPQTRLAPSRPSARDRFECRSRLPAEDRPCLVDVGLHRPLLSGPCGRADDLVAARRVAERGDGALGELIDRQRPAAAEVEHSAGGLGLFNARTQPSTMSSM